MKLLAILLALALSTPIHAQSMKGMDMKDMQMKDTPMKKSDTKIHKGTGVVKSVDAQKGTVTLDHGPIKSLEWPAMTMGFVAKDKKMLEPIKPGTKIEFEFVQEGSKYMITSIK